VDVGRRAALLVVLLGCTPFGEAETPDSGGSGDASPFDGGSACSGPVLVGTDVMVGTNTNVIGQSYLDVYGYVATAQGVARCAHVNIEPLDGTSSAIVAVYESNGGRPGKLRAVGRIPMAVAGWNVAPLERDVEIKAGEVFWIGLLPSRDVVVRIVPTCPPSEPTLLFTRIGGGGPPPADFPLTAQSASFCRAPFYLTP
jgi:hypothetical protein